MDTLFDLKQSVAGIFSTHKAYSRVIAGENELFKKEEKVFEKIADFEHDADSVQELRYKNRNNILRLQSALARVDSREESKLDKDFIIEEQTTIKEWREYEKNLRNQVYDIKMIVDLLKKIIDSEKYEALLDIETPLDIIEEYFKRLNGILRHRTLNKEIYSGMLDIIGEMKVSYQGLVEVTMKIIDNDSKYFGQDISLDVYFKNRSKLKQQLNGKTQALLAQIQRFEDILVGLAKEHDKQYANAIMENPTYYKKKEALSALKKKHDIEFTKALLENVSYFKKQFKELVQFCNDRIQISNRIMVEAAALQLKKSNELIELKANLDALYAKFLTQQLKLQKDLERKQSTYLSEQVKKRIKEFSDYRNALKTDTKKLDNFILSIEEEDIRDLKKESSNIQSAKTRMLDYSRKFAATVVLLTGMSVLAPTQMTQSSNSLDPEMNYRHVIVISAIGTKNAETLGSLLDFLPPELFAVDAELRKGVLNRLLKANIKIDSSLNKLGLGSTGNLDYLKNLYLARKCASDSALSKYTKPISDADYIAKVQKAIMKNNPEFNDLKYNEDLIDKYAPKMLIFWIHPIFMKGILNMESGSQIFSVSFRGASGPYQIMRDTWKDYTDLDYDTFVWVSEISLKISIRHVNTVTTFLMRNDPRWKNDTYDVITKLATVAMVYDCGQGTYADNSYRRENFDPGEATDYYNNMEAYLKKFKGIFS